MPWDGSVVISSTVVASFSGSARLLGWKVDAGDLQAVEQEAGAARVELVLGEFLEDLADAVLDGACGLRAAGV